MVREASRDQRDEYDVTFKWADDPNAADGCTAWSIFPQSSTYFDPGKAPFMMNFRVEGLKELLARLRSEGVWVDDKYEEYDYGNFGWIMDSDGNCIEPMGTTDEDIGVNRVSLQS